MEKIKLKKNEVLVLRSVDKEFKSRGGFQYPKKGLVICDDYKDDNECGNGLHGLEFGNTISYDITSDYNGYYLIIKVNKTKGYNILNNLDKVKFKEGIVELVFDDYNKALDYLRDNYKEYYKSFVKDYQTAGYYSTQKAGYSSTQTAGDWSVSILNKDGIQKLYNNSIGIINNYNNINPKQLIINKPGTYYIINCEIIKEYNCTPENIEVLEENEIFVFGSNGKGYHDGGTARLAVEKFGAIYGQADGIQGQSFAINTMDGIEKIKEGIEDLKQYAQENIMKILFLTKIGCGISGYKVEDIKPLVQDLPINVILPKEFII